MYTAGNISAGVMFKSSDCCWTEVYIAGITYFMYTFFGHVEEVWVVCAYQVLVTLKDSCLNCLHFLAAVKEQHIAFIATAHHVIWS
jgi:hypothetical protein